MHPNGASRNNDDQAIFSKDGPYLISPALTNKPRVIPKIYKLRNNKRSGKPNFKIETPNKGDVKIIAGINPIRVLTNAVKINDTIISFNFKGAINKLVKFLLQISSRKSILKLMRDLNKIS